MRERQREPIEAQSIEPVAAAPIYVRNMTLSDVRSCIHWIPRVSEYLLIADSHASHCYFFLVNNEASYSNAIGLIDAIPSSTSHIFCTV